MFYIHILYIIVLLLTFFLNYINDVAEQDNLFNNNMYFVNG